MIYKSRNDDLIRFYINGELDSVMDTALYVVFQKEYVSTLGEEKLPKLEELPIYEDIPLNMPIWKLGKKDDNHK